MKNSDDLKKTLQFYNVHIIQKLTEDEYIEFQKELYNDSRLNERNIVELYMKYPVLAPATFVALKESNDKIKEEYYNSLKSKDLSSNRIIFELLTGTISEDELYLDILGDDYINILKEEIKNRKISLTMFQNFKMLDKEIILDIYNNSITDRTEENFENQDIDFWDIVFIYLAQDHLFDIKDILKIIEEKKDPIFNDNEIDLKLNIAISIYRVNELFRNENVSIDMVQKVRELYLNGLLSFNELAQLSKEGIISSEDAQAINNELCSKELVENLRGINLGGSIENKSTSSHTNDSKHHKNGKTFKDYLEKMPDKNSLVSQQTEVMLEILKQYGFEPLSTQPNAYSFSEIQTFSSGNFENYMVLLSEEIPEVAILMHSKHVKNTDIYYQTGGNATYVLSTAKLKEYLEQLGVIESKFSHLNMTKKGLKTDDPYLRTANVTKNWGINVARKIYEVLHMLEQPVLEEYSNSIRKSKTSSFNPETILPKNLSDKAREERLEAITMFNDELAELKEQIENNENHGY